MSNSLITQNQFTVALDVNSTVDGWLVKSVRSDSARAADMRNDKSKAVHHFFDWIGKSPEQIVPKDVQEWLVSLEEDNLALGTRYNRVSALSNYFDYLRNDVGLIRQIPINPAHVSRIKAPEPFSSESVLALSNEELFALLEIVESYSATGDLASLRDYAILQMFIMTGKRREEIIGLRGTNIKIKSDRFFIRTKIKGGHFLSFEMQDATAQNALFDYLEATGRGAEIFGTDEPLWLRHSTGGKIVRIKIGRKLVVSNHLSSHGFERRIKNYALEAGIEDFHIHRLRHTFARIVSETAESMADTQEALDHSNIKTTQVYVKRLKVKKDKASSMIREKLDIERRKIK